MKFNTKEEAIIVQNSLIKKLHEKEESVIQLKKGVLKINSIVAKFKNAETPYILEIHSLNIQENTPNISYEEFKTLEELKEYKEKLIVNVEDKKDINVTIFSYRFNLDSDFNCTYTLLSIYHYVGLNVNHNVVFYNLMLLRKTKYKLQDQSFLPQPYIKADNKSLNFDNVDKIYEELVDIIENYNESLDNLEFKPVILNSNPDGSPKYSEVTSVFNNLSTQNLILSICNDTKSVSFQLNEMYHNQDSLDDVKAVIIELTL